MIICPTCHRGFKNEEVISKHFLQCWKAHNPNHVSKSAPEKEHINKREVSEEVLNFFAAFRKN